MSFEEARIRVVQHSDNDEFSPTLDPAFVVLGMLNEYVGRHAIEDNATVERFFVDERPIADLFAGYLRQYAVEVGIDSSEVSVTQAESGHSYVESVQMNNRVNALYEVSYSEDQFITMSGGRRLRRAHVALGFDKFPPKRSMLYEPDTMNPRFSYLYGVLLRFGRENGEIAMANASQKVDLVKRILEDLDVNWISHRYSVDGAPRCHVISFEPRPRLVGFLARAARERAEACSAVAVGADPH